MEWWKDYFDEVYFRLYQGLEKVEIVQREVDFIERALELKKGMMVLDIACGSGRHVIELEKRGYEVIGIDYSGYLISVAKRRSEKVKWVRGDMRNLPFKEYFDAAYIFFTAFGYFQDEENLKTLMEVNRVLKKEGKFLLELINPFWVLDRFQRRMWFEGEGILCLEENEFDLHSMRVHSKRKIMKDGKVVDEREHSIRIYLPGELSFLLNLSGFIVKNLYGDHSLSPFERNSRRLIILAEKG
ncbi:class I SAM-dependent methyltransferase [bacterium]|nr:MAG: class I SAM-dependent methyltransferase [bacterium]